MGVPAIDPVLKRAQFNQKINSLTQVMVAMVMMVVLKISVSLGDEDHDDDDDDQDGDGGNRADDHDGDDGGFWAKVVITMYHNTYYHKFNYTKMRFIY